MLITVGVSWSEALSLELISGSAAVVAAKPRLTVSLFQRGMSAKQTEGFWWALRAVSISNPSPPWGAPFGKGSLLQWHLHVFCVESLGFQLRRQPRLTVPLFQRGMSAQQTEGF